MFQIWAQEQSTVVLIEIIIWDAVLIWLNDGISSNLPFELLSLDLIRFHPDPTTSKR